MSDALPYLELLHEGVERGGLQTDDILFALLPLYRQIARWHEQGKVAPLDGVQALSVSEEGALFIAAEPLEPTSNLVQIERLQQPISSALHVVGRSSVLSDADQGIQWKNLEVAGTDGKLEHPVFVGGFRSWEHALGHHDALTDIFSLGLLLAGLACGLDFTEEHDVRIFADSRENLFALNPRLHPVIAAVIVEMTQLNRHALAPDLQSQIRRLESYRDQTLDVDVGRLAGFKDALASNRRQLVHAHLRERLFEISRRNRLLYFRPSQGTLNLTEASVPLVLDLRSIRLDQLCVWQPALAGDLCESRAIMLGRWLRFDDQPFLPSALDRIIADARRDRAEYGFAQLRLVIAFLHWHDLKEAPQERIASPLLLLPVELAKRKGVRDQYVLQAVDSEAEVNPVLRHHLRQLYGLDLPATIDLRETPLELFHEALQGQIRASEPGVTLRLVTEPQIELIHQRARQRLDHFRRRQKLRSPAHKSKAQFSYSYERNDFRPLGLQLFREKVLPAPLPQRAATDAPPAPRQPQMMEAAPDVAESERQTFELKTDRSGNPYQWDFDLCSLTLGNFNYRKMSLVRDYGTLLETDLASAAFDRVFSVDPRAIDETLPPPLPKEERWSVVAGDATQTAAIGLARVGRSYIIQGPPGTGKSQTITNLIADYVARGQRVLFVCEKRAALDVVFHRLHRQGLDELCCLIHDSQTDKKQFVLNLKQTYETWLAAPDETGAALQRRQALLGQMTQDLEPLQRFDEAMCSAPEGAGCTLRELVHRLVELRRHEPRLSAAQAELLPAYAHWRRWGGLVQRLSATLAEVSGVQTLAQHPLRWAGAAVVHSERPLETLNDLADRAEGLLDELDAKIADSGLPEAACGTLNLLHSAVQFARQFARLSTAGEIALLDVVSAATRELLAQVGELERRERTLALQREKTRFWRDKLAAADVEAARAEAREQERSWLRFVSPTWWRLKRVLHARYDFKQHAVAPRISHVLNELAAEYAAANACAQTREQSSARFGTDQPAQLAADLALLQSPTDPVGATVREHLLRSAHGGQALAGLLAIAAILDRLPPVLDGLLADFRGHELAALGEVVRDLREASDCLADVLPLLTELDQAPGELRLALRRLPLTAAPLEAAMARKSLETIYRQQRWLLRFDGRALASRAERIADTERQWLAQNAASVRAEVRQRFRANVQRSTLAISQLDAAGKAFKKTYGAGRRELEHEFGKSMRYKAIRELVSGDSGRVVRDLKPIWLMSPLSVSDTLPLEPDLFDVVIFDEASQIPVEEAVPALYRAPQVIVVGDEMQLPPTSFFAAARDDDDDLVEVEEAGERMAIALDADSLLAQSAKNLPATVLQWHYRSRSESLIGFSNAAFYAGELYTIPDRSLPTQQHAEIEVREAQDGAANADALLARPISFHHLGNGVYDQRRNQRETAYIAVLVRELLRRQTGLSLGIVAFSQAQQSEIESALESLAAEDAQFAAQLEAEYVREEEDQFCGLFVKNLENVQGDERDVIILSICYGPGPDSRMLMNFGPINQRGGEKRLNVIFSRARHFMAVVSSIRSPAITNDYNDGAAALKNFLRYAECMSRGDAKSARVVLENLSPLTRKALASAPAQDAVVTQLAAALRGRGHTVDEQVGQSRFRCDLAVRDPSGERYAVGILVDTAAYYANRDIEERCVTRPQLLKVLGWRAGIVLSRDWYHEPQTVVDRIERMLRDEPEAMDLSDQGAADVVAPPPPVSQPAPVAVEPGPVDADPALDGTQPVRIARRRFELTDGHSDKFWEISADDCLITIRFGRRGSQGQMQTKQFPTRDRTRVEVERLVGEKLRKGYEEAGEA